jgi:hypothetical protein
MPMLHQLLCALLRLPSYWARDVLLSAEDAPLEGTILGVLR